MLDGRYSRQVSLPQIGRVGQERISAARVLVLGCGALGSVQAELLARAGVGHLRIVDRDIPDMSNLQRQFLFDEEDVRACRPKATAAVQKLRAINSEIELEALVKDVSAANILQLFDGVDLVLDGVDNFETRYLLNDACVQQGIPWVYGGVQGTGVLCMPVLPNAGPCLQCVFPEAPPQGSVTTCDVSGVLNAAPALASSLQVSLALRILVEGPESVANDVRLVSVNPWLSQAQSLGVSKREDCPCCALRQFPFLQAKKASRTASLCGRKAIQVTPLEPVELALPALAERLASVGKVTLRQEVVELEVDAMRLVIFSDARVVVHGTADPGQARSLVARYLG